MFLSRRLLAVAGAAALAVTAVGPVAGSSHREAPLITEDPTADNTDVYAFVNADDPSTVTLIANFVPLEEPDSGPNFYNFDPDVLYEIHVDNDGDARDDVTYQFKFRTRIQNKNVGGYNTGPVTELTDPDFNYRQTYSVTRIKDGRKDQIGSNLRTPPVNIGPRSTPDYALTAAMGVQTLAGGTKVFAGQREEGFFVDIGSIADLAGLRPSNAAHIIPLAPGAGVDGLSGFDVHSIAVRVPIKHLTRDGEEHAATSPMATVGVYASASRQRVRILSPDGNERNAGKYVQVSRLANPLVNELLIPIGMRDHFNRQSPRKDSQFEKFIAKPEPAALFNKLYPSLSDIQEEDRQDLVGILLTGVKGLNYTGNVKADLMRLNTGLKPNANGACFAPSLSKPANAMPSRLGVLDGDLCGFPNGRRLSDDVVDIEIRSIAQGYGTFLEANFGLPNKAVNNTLGDGVDANDAAFLPQFPYLGTPWQGYSHPHHHAML